MAGTAGTGAADPIGAVIATAAPAVFIHSPHRAPPGMPAASHPAPTAGICAPASTTNRLTASPEPPITARTRGRARRCRSRPPPPRKFCNTPVSVAYATSTANLPSLRAGPDNGGYPQPSNWGTWVSSCSPALPNHFCSRAAAVPSRYIWLTALLTASQPLTSPFLMPMPYRS